MKIFIIDFLKFGAFFAGWTFVFSLVGAGVWVVAGSDRIKAIIAK